MWRFSDCHNLRPLSFLHPQSLRNLKKVDDPQSDIIGREFEFHYKGRVFNCKYGRPSTELMAIARYIQHEKAPETTTLKQIKPFKDVQTLDKLPEWVQRYFGEREPVVFRISCHEEVLDKEWVNAFRALNFLMKFYDRASPEIVLHEDDVIKSEAAKQSRYIKDKFPAVLKGRDYDQTLMLLRESTRQNNPRLSYVFCYNVLEYCGYYYIDSKVRSEIESILKDPTVMGCCDKTVEKMTSLVTNINMSDDAKMQKIMEQYCDPIELWKEIEANKDFFLKDLKFDGGFSIAGLINKEMNVETWCKTWVKHSYDHITKIRNVLIHAREKREANSISPTKRNGEILANYLPFMKRMSEQLIMKM